MRRICSAGHRCGAGRHAFESLRRGAHVVALDTDVAELQSVSAMFAAMAEAGFSVIVAGTPFDQTCATDMREDVTFNAQKIEAGFSGNFEGGLICRPAPTFFEGGLFSKGGHE